jgi:tRNA A37 threonylcarbamoyladenosine dehydratase
LARAGVGAMTIEMVDITNINRQLPRYIQPWTAKIKIVADRLMDINPALNYTGRGISIPERAFESEEFDYVLDCIDSIT